MPHVNVSRGGSPEVLGNDDGVSGVGVPGVGNIVGGK